MNILECDNCHVLFNGDNLTFAYDIYTEKGEVDDDKAVWDDYLGSYIRVAKCPVCKSGQIKERQ